MASQQQQQQVDGLLSPGDEEIEQQVDSSVETGNVIIHEDFLLSEMGRSRDMDRQNQPDDFRESSLEMRIMQAEKDERMKNEAQLTSQQRQEINDLFPPGKIEQQVDGAGIIVNKIEESLRNLAPEPCERVSSVTGIYRVPQKLREGSEQYYTPRVVSIGPFHYGNQKYAAMEKIKLISLDLLRKESSQPLEFYVDKFKDYADTARSYYAEKVVGELQSNDDFLQMMLVDGAFIIRFMITFGVSNNDVSYKEADPEARKLRDLSPQDVFDIKHDLCLLENQLPFSFLERLNWTFFDNQKSQRSKIIWRKDLTSLAAEIWPELLPMTKHPDTQKPRSCPCMLLSMKFWLQLLLATEHPGTQKPRHFLDLLRNSKLPARMNADEKDSKKKQLKHSSIMSAKKLHDAGLRVKGVEDRHRSEYATFKGHTLKISRLEIDDTSLGLYKNITALEQCRYPNAQHVSDYLILMEMLSRDGSEDLLVKNRVLVNYLTTDSTTASSVLRELCKNITYSSRPFGLGTPCRAVTDYCNKPTRRFRAGTKTWQIGAAIILFLTLVQTVCSVLALFGITVGRSTKL